MNSSPVDGDVPVADFHGRLDIAEHRVVLQQVGEVAALVTSLTATKSISCWANAARMTLRPIRPNPLIPTLTAIVFLLRSKKTPKESDPVRRQSGTKSPAGRAAIPKTIAESC